MNTTQGLVSSTWVFGWVLGLLALWGTATADELYISAVRPAEVQAGDYFIVEGNFAGVEGASAFLCDGSSGVAVELVQVSDNEFVGRAGLTPWTVSGTVHLLVHGAEETVADQTVVRGEYEISLYDARFNRSRAAVHGGTLTIDASPLATGGVHISNGSMAWMAGGGYGDCEEGQTYFVEIEPDTTWESVGNASPCPPISLMFRLDMSNGPDMSQEDYIQNLVAAFNQAFGSQGLAMSADPNATSLDEVTISLTGCKIVSGFALVHCDY